MNQVQLRPYSVEKGRTATNWWAELTILNELKTKGAGNWTPQELSKYWQLKQLAASWTTCACGNQCSIIPRKDGRPIDSELSILGGYFYQHVRDLNIEPAVSTLEAIEKRSEYLIKEILKNAKSAN